jgi:hypothetical protein
VRNIRVRSARSLLTARLPHNFKGDIRPVISKRYNRQVAQQKAWPFWGRIFLIPLLKKSLKKIVTNKIGKVVEL